MINMNKSLYAIVVAAGLLTGCQSIGDHLNCQAEVDRTVPAQTQQRYLRTDTKCVRSGQQSLGGGMGTINNPSMGDVNCSSVPIYETIVLNQPQRDAAYQACRNNVSNQRVSNSYYSQNSPSNYTPSLKTKYSADTPYCKGIADKNSSEYKAQCQQSTSAINGKSVYNIKDAKIACTSATVVGSPAYNKCVDELVKTSK